MGDTSSADTGIDTGNGRRHGWWVDDPQRPERTGRRSRSASDAASPLREPRLDTVTVLQLGFPMSGPTIMKPPSSQSAPSRGKSVIGPDNDTAYVVTARIRRP